MPNITQIPAPRVPVIDGDTKLMTVQWFRYFNNINTIVGGGTGVTPPSSGGTGTSTIPVNGQILIGNNTGTYTVAYLTASAGLFRTNGNGALTVGISDTGVTAAAYGTASSVGSFAVNARGQLTAAANVTIAIDTSQIISGLLAISRGGTNSSATPTNGGVSYGTGTAYAFSAAGTIGQVLTSAGAASPTWTSQSSLSVGTATNLLGGLAGSLPYQSGAGSTTFLSAGSNGQVLTLAGGLPSWSTPTTGTVTSVSATAPVVSSGGATPNISMAAATTSVNGYLTSTDWNTFNNKGSGTVTSVAALTLGTTGTDLSSSVATGTTTPVITLNVPTASALNRGALSAADWTTFNNKGSGTVTSVSGTTPVVSSGGATPAISMAAATTSVNGYLTSTDWNTFNNKGSGSVTSVSFTGGLITVATATTTPALTVAGTSGGVPYFTSASTWASSAVLASNALMIGGGAGATPATTATGTGVLTALGTNIGTAGSFVVNGGALGTPSSGTVTNLTGTASININGTVGATTANTGAFTTLSTSDQLTLTKATDYNLYASGAGGNYFAGRIGIGSAAIAGDNIRVNRGLTGGTTARSFINIATVQSDVTTSASFFQTESYTQAAAFTLGSMQHYVAAQGSFGAGSTVTNQFGFSVSANLTGATNNYGFYSAIASGANRFNFYAVGTAINVFVGNTTLGGTVGAQSLQVNNVASAVNYLQIEGSTSTTPTLSAQGSSADVDILLTPKGTGNVRFGTYTAGILAQTGYITVKDAGGTSRRLLVG
jgi:hypothetical protein